MSLEDFKPRHVGIVAAYILSQLPEDQEDFKKDISRLLKSLFYVAPEDMLISSKWMLLDTVMKRYISDLDSPWKEEIVNIYIGKTPVPEF